MRTTATCPKCSGTKIVVDELRQIAPGVNARPVPALAWETNSGPLGAPEVKQVGSFEAWICAACGYTEFYAKYLWDIDKLAAERPDDVRIVHGINPQRGPFR
jgi:predicted nucleic-acid-binding Zn-ribbon protein